MRSFPPNSPVSRLPTPVSRPILSATSLSKSFTTPEGGTLRVLDNISLDLRQGEIVALLGRSGSGKSTLLRCLIGLVSPSKGKVIYNGQPVVGPPPGMAMVFQSFALFPWLTVAQNVALGLKAQGIGVAEREARALAAIDLIGLDGFESAYPKELSGGMRQRVGVARAIAANPDLLMMDEPFSALDVLTAENLRSELLDLWQERRIPTRAILIVTHNIEEAVLMADRIIVLSPNPGRLSAEVQVDLPRPRDRDNPAFRELVEHVYRIMTSPREEASQADADRTTIAYRLPAASVEAIGGLLDRVSRGPDFGRDDLPQLAEAMHLEVDDLFPIVDAAELLGFADVRQGDISLLPAGQRFAAADIQGRKQLFATQLMQRVPLVAHIQQILAARADHRAVEDRFLRELEDHLSAEDAEAILATAIAWGRYAELFEYDTNSGVLSGG